MNERHDPCPDAEVLAQYTEGALPKTARERLEAHLADCDACRLTARDLVQTFERPPEGAAVAPGLADRILSALPLDVDESPPHEDSPAPIPQARPPEGASMSRFVRPVLTAAAVVLVALGLFWIVEGVQRSGGHLMHDGDALPVAETLPIDEVQVPPAAPDLGGNERYLAHVSTDKPLYRPGERVYARAVVLHAFRRTLYEGGDGFGTVEVKSSRGEVVHRRSAVIEGGIAPFGWEIPKGQAGGVYTVVASFPYAGIPKSETTIDVRQYRAPRLKTDLQFLRKAYGPGDEVVATLEVRRAEGGIPAGASVTAIARVDGEEIMSDDALALDAHGRCTVSFELRDEIAEGVGTLALAIRDGGVQQTAAKTIPIILNKVDLRFYPEGGDLVAGVPCGVYFEARNTRDEPADVAGRIVDDGGAEVARFSSSHEGRGRVAFAPKAGVSYRAVIERPAGIAEPVALPAVAEGIMLRALEPRYGSDAPIRVAVAATKDMRATVGLYVRERELGLQAVRLRAGQAASVSLTPTDAASGVLRVTVYDAEGRPQAERLVFREPPVAVRLEITPDREATVPGGRVTFQVKATDARGRPVTATLGIAASDDAVLATVDPRERAPRLPVQALLGAEVRELRDAHRYLGADPHRLDLLLGTQGWRRFAFVDPAQFQKSHGEAGQRALAVKLPPPPRTRGGGWGQPGEAARAIGLRGWKKKGDELDIARENAPMGEGQDRGGPEEEEALVVEGLELKAAEVLQKAEELPRKRPARADFADEEDADEFQGTPAWMRLYAHKADPNRGAGRRTDFTETVFWQAGRPTDEAGVAEFSFDAADSITSVRIRVDGVTRGGALGHADAVIEVRRPFYLEPKFPLQVSAGDRVELPIALSNGSEASLMATLEIETGDGLRVLGAAQPPLTIPARSSIRHIVTVAVGETRGIVSLRVRARAGAHLDDVTRSIEVVPAGFPIEESRGGVLSDVAEIELTVPERLVHGSVQTETVVFPTPLASLEEALDRLLREPHGCFEQTSSTNYPNVMALQYMASHSGVKPASVRRARDLLDRGYKRLASFECKEKGYEWFGGDPGHEALTAYGVLEFHDMAQVMNVDAAMVARTRKWLLDRRDGDGGFRRNARALDSFGRAPEAITNAYILWALSEAGEDGLEKEIAALRTAATGTKDSYLLALAANVLWLSGDPSTSKKLMSRLGERQAEDGGVDGAETSITRSGGNSLRIEATSLAILAWLRDPAYAANVEAAMRWLSESCQGGRFGSTQATVLALKAITTYDAARASISKAGSIVLSLNGQPLEEVAFAADHQGPIKLPDLAHRLGPGAHKLRLEMRGGGSMPYAFTLRYNALTPASTAAPVLDLETRLAKAKANEGEPVEVAVDVRNRTGEGQPMAVAIVGLPGGLEARAEQLKELVREGKVDAFETRGREVILYWRSLAPRAHHALRIDCVAAVPGTYTGPASRTYLYYTDEHKVWKDGLSIEISGK